MLDATPYSLDQTIGPKLIGAAQDVAEQVGLLRRRGALDENTLRGLRKEWGVQQVYESAGIEGNQLTLSETALAIQRGITISGKPPDHSDEVRRLHEAHEYLEELVHAKTPLAESELKSVHTLILGRGDEDAGAYRRVEVALTNSPHVPPHPIKVMDCMGDYFRWLQREGDVPVPLLAAVAHAWLVHIHPFRDGNGRTARAIMNLLLIRHGYPIVVIRRKDRQRYYDALRSSDDGDIGPFLELITDRLRDSLKHIDRIRNQSVGLNLAMEKVRAAEERRFKLWADGIELLATAIEDCAKKISDNDPTFSTSVTQLDRPTFEDYRAICGRDPSGNTWLMKLGISHATRTYMVLLWVGFSSEEMMHGLKQDSPLPTVWVSVHNPGGYPAWILPDASFPSPAREFAFFDGRYFRREQTEAGFRVLPTDSVLTLATSFVAKLVEGWFAR